MILRSFLRRWKKESRESWSQAGNHGFSEHSRILLSYKLMQVATGTKNHSHCDNHTLRVKIIRLIDSYRVKLMNWIPYPRYRASVHLLTQPFHRYSWLWGQRAGQSCRNYLKTLLVHGDRDHVINIAALAVAWEWGRHCQWCRFFCPAGHFQELRNINVPVATRVAFLVAP